MFYFTCKHGLILTSSRHLATDDVSNGEHGFDAFSGNSVTEAVNACNSVRLSA